MSSAPASCFDCLPVSRTQRLAAQSRLEDWFRSCDEADRAACQALIDAGQVEELYDAMHADLGFGTGGCRGLVGIGPNRFNRETLTRLVSSHATWLLRAHPDAIERGVAIGWDTRQFFDVRCAYCATRPPLVLGASSLDFAHHAADVYGAFDLPAYVPSTGGTVGQLSYAVRAVHAVAGLYISASHNPPDHNGAKLYDAHGCQVVPPRDAAIAETVADRAVLTTAALRRALPDTVRDGFFAALADAVPRGERSLHIVYTALNGAGADAVPRTLRDAGHRVDIVPEQHVPDGRFAAVPGQSPNPERAGVLFRAMAVADAVGATLVMGTDPDADRIGVAQRDATGWRVFDGNELAVLGVYEALKTAPEGALVLRTAVTSCLVSTVARAAGARVVDDLRVGFKYLCRAMDIHGGPFAIAVEESHGLLVTPALRDKDAVGAARLLARAAAAEPLSATLERLYATHGPVGSTLATVALTGVDAAERLRATLNRLRGDPPTHIAGHPVCRMEDWLAGLQPTSPTERASRDVLRLWLDDGVVTLRPSGTETKVKVYVERWGAPGTSRDALDSQLAILAEAALAWVSDGAARTGPETAG